MRVLWLLSLLTFVSLPICAGLSADVAPAPAETSNLVGNRLIEMFQAGFDRGTNVQKQARRFYEGALEESNGDPRVEYAYGLVLLKQLKNKEALSQFQLALKPADSDFVPAWQAVIWMHFIAKDYPTGYDRLRNLARRLADPKSQLDQSEREHTAEWIGRVIAALQKSVDTVKQRETLLREDESLREILGPELHSSLARGRSGVHSLHAMMEDDVQQAREGAEAKSQKERAEKEAQVARDLEASTEKREALKKSAEESKKYFDQQLEAFDKQLTRLERDYEFLQKRILSLTASQVQLNAEMALLSNQAAAARQRPNENSSQKQLAQTYEQRMTFLEVQAVKYQVELDQSIMSTMTVSQRAQAVASQRAAAVQQYGRATGQIVQQDSALDKWQNRLQKDGEKLKSPAKGKAAPVVNKIQQARSFRTYVDLDLTLERDRLLDSFGVAMPEKSVAP